MSSRAAVVVVAIGLTMAGCGGSDVASTSTTAAATTTTTAPPTTVATTTTAPAITTTTTSTTTTMPPPPFSGDFQLVLATGPNDWESQFIDPGGVVFHDGRYHMFYNGISGWPAPVAVGYATSDDGLKWERESDEPVFTTEDVPYVGITAFVSSAVVAPDGTWMMFFYSVESQSTFAGTALGRATAPGPLGPWVADPEPILVVGDEGSWDSVSVSHPGVVATEAGWALYYDGHAGDRGDLPDRSIGVAFSGDGVEWTKHDANPLITPGAAGEWDEARVYDPNVVATPDGWAMVYFTSRPEPDEARVEYQGGLAISDDGLTWRPSDANPFFSSGRFGFQGVFLATMVFVDNSFRLFFDAQTGFAGRTSVWIRAHDGSLVGS